MGRSWRQTLKFKWRRTTSRGIVAKQTGRKKKWRDRLKGSPQFHIFHKPSNLFFPNEEGETTRIKENPLLEHGGRSFPWESSKRMSKATIAGITKSFAPILLLKMVEMFAATRRNSSKPPSAVNHLPSTNSVKEETYESNDSKQTVQERRGEVKIVSKLETQPSLVASAVRASRQCVTNFGKWGIVCTPLCLLPSGTEKLWTQDEYS